MTRTGRILAAAIASFAILTAALWLLSAASVPASSSYAVVSLDRDADEKRTVAALGAAGLDGILCESTEYVWINDFGVWERVPLDAYSDRIARFDPRDDGYAEKVRSLFVGSDARRIFLKRTGRAVSFEKKVSDALGGLRFDLDFAGGFSPLPLVSFLLLAGGIAFISMRLKTVVPAALLASCFTFAAYGSGAIASLGFLCAASLFASRAFEESFRSGSFERRRPAAEFAAPSIWCSFAYAAASLVAGVPAVVAVTAFGATGAGVFAAAQSAHLLSLRRGHLRFRPLGLRSAKRTALLRMSFVLVPFAAAAALTAIAAPFFAPRPGRSFAEAFVRADYEAHLEFQRSFMTRPLVDAQSQKVYTLFASDGGGFPVVSGAEGSVSPLPKLELPPAERFAFDGASPASGSGRSFAAADSPFGTIGSIAVTLLAIALSVPSLMAAGLNRKRIKAASMAAEKRIAA